MRFWDYQKARSACATLATVVFIGLMLPVVGELGASGHWVLAWAVIAAAVALYCQALRVENLFVTRLRARVELDLLAEELDSSGRAEGVNYQWQKTVPRHSFGAFANFQRSTAADCAALRQNGASLDSASRRFFWISPGAARRAWTVIGFEAKRARRALTDSVYWSTGAHCVLLMSTGPGSPSEGSGHTVH